MSKILVIDDDAMARRMAEFLLKKLNMEVTCAASGAEGLEQLRCEVPAAVLLDVEMPGESGVDVLQAIRAEAALQSVPVFFMTGTLSDDLRAVGDSLGVRDYLIKPITVPALKTVLEESGIL